MTEQTIDNKVLYPTNNPINIQPIGQNSLLNVEPENIKINIVGTSCETEKPIGPLNFPNPAMETSSNSQRSGWLNWIQGTVNTIGSKVTEKAKNSMDTMITTLDPQMKQFINTGGDLDLIVASNKDVKVASMRESFQQIFGKANVSGVQNNTFKLVAQPVGIESALKSAEERINNVREGKNVHPEQPVVSIEGFIIELLPDNWFEMSLLLLDDPWHDLIIQMFTQAVPIPTDIIYAMKDHTASSYEYKETGFAVTIGETISKMHKIPHTNWHEQFAGTSRKNLLLQAGKSLAYVYKSKLPKNVI